MFTLTPQERQAVFFLGAVALAGIGIDYSVKCLPAVRAIACSNRNLGKVELNRADKAALISIPGIGEKMAQRIMEYREREGGFKAVGELENIKGLGKNRFLKIRELVYVQ